MEPAACNSRLYASGRRVSHLLYIAVLDLQKLESGPPSSPTWVMFAAGKEKE
jgi:hypothetical protein